MKKKKTTNPAAGLDGGQLRVKLSSTVARALHRRPGWFVLRVSARLHHQLSDEAARRENAAGLPAGGVPLGVLAASLLEEANHARELHTYRTAAERCRRALAVRLAQLAP